MAMDTFVHVGTYQPLIGMLVILLIAVNIGLFIWGVRNRGRLPEWPFFVQGSMAALSALVLTAVDMETELCGHFVIVCLLMYLMGVILIWINRNKP